LLLDGIAMAYVDILGRY